MQTSWAVVWSTCMCMPPRFIVDPKKSFWLLGVKKAENTESENIIQFEFVKMNIHWGQSWLKVSNTS